MKVKIDLEEGQSPFEAEEELFKALSSHRTGDLHEEDRFLDPATQHLSEIMGEVYAKIFAAMLIEIQEVLDEKPE